MTPVDHNRVIGWIQLGYGTFHLLSLMLVIVFEGFMFQHIYSRSMAMDGPPPQFLLGLILVFIGVIGVATSVPSIVAGIALLKRKSWARIAGIIAGAVAATSFPVGTGVAVYTFWFLFSDNGKHLYGGSINEMPPPPPNEWQPQGWSQVDRSKGLISAE